MNVCTICGSGTRDKDGFCGGCGTAWHATTAAAASGKPGSMGTSPTMQPLSRFDPIAASAIKPKQVWVAVTLAVLGGPFGMLYSTTLGAIVMLVVSAALEFWLGHMSLLITLPICAVWAWRAARNDSSIFD